METILGVSAFYHDSAACLVRAGAILAAAQEERFSREVGDARAPVQATAACLAHARLKPTDVDLVVFYEKPLLKLERILENHLQVAPRGLWQWRMMARRLWGEKLHIERSLRALLPGFRGDVAFVEHHEAHAASAFFPSPFDEAAVLTVDGVGEWATASWGVGSGGRLELHEEIVWPHSLGLLYSAVTAALGFRVNRDEYKVMGLAAYGEPRLVDWIDAHLVRRYADGSCAMRPGLLSYRYGRHMVSRDFERALGAPLRADDGSLTLLAKDLAASVQCVLEEQVLAMAHHVHERTRLSALCVAGGVAYNCVANGRLRREGPFESMWIQPAAGDSGGAIGAAMLGSYRSGLTQERRAALSDSMNGAMLGPAISRDDAEKAISLFNLQLRSGTLEASIDAAAEALASGEIIAVAHGNMEFGPRALGNRSILADSRQPNIQATLNARIKHREGFRPFAPAVLAEHAVEVFRMSGTDSPYMLETYFARTTIDGAARDWRTHIAGAVHVDGSARVQTVAPRHPGILRPILERFYARTGCPVLINTSFNDADMPIAASAADACEAMRRTGINLLVLGETLVARDRSTAGLANRTTAETRLNLGKLSKRVLHAARLGPRLLADLVLTIAFVLVVVPVGLVHQALNRGAESSARGTSQWRRRERSQSNLMTLF